jgi:CubicO group peptidase (beta-lactamase class C family)
MTHRHSYRFAPTALVLVACATSPTSAFAQVDPAIAARVDDIFAQWSTDTSPGCAVGVTQNGETLLERAYGMADLEWGIPNTPETIFEGGSVSKQFTAAAVNLLVLDGTLSLDDDVRRWVPELPDYGHTITLHHLMTHTSGLRDWGSVASISGWGRENRAHDHDDVVDILSRQTRLNFEPGLEYSYSNSGYNLLAVVVDRASGESFADFSKTRLFEPAGMTDTQWRDSHRRIIRGRSSAYNRTEEGWEINRPVEYVHGNGGILTTVRDLGTWNQVLTTGGPWGPEFLALMHKPGVLNDGSEINYAGGLMLSPLDNVQAVTHTGSTAGYRAYLARFPEQGISVAMLCNASNVSTGGNGNRIARAFLGDAVREDGAPDYRTESEGFDLEPFVGLYREPLTGGPLEITLRDGVLYERSTPLLPLSGSEFQVGNGDRRYVFDRYGSTVIGFRVEDWQYSDRRYERVTAWAPSPTELSAFEGEYRSEDAETTYRVTATERGLELWQRPNNTFDMSPVYDDGFRSGGRIVRFLRDGAGRVTELSLSIGRVYDMRFQRLPR